MPMLRIVLPVMLCCFMTLNTIAQKKSNAPSIQKVRVEWEIITNQANGKSGFQSAFTFTNTGKSDLPATGWSLYFNMARAIRPESVGGDMVIENINGDLFKLRPGAAFKGLKPGQSVKVPFVGSDWVINFTDAPAGLFWVLDQDASKGFTVADYRIIPATQLKQIQRNADDKYGFTTPADIYKQNSRIQDLPVESLTKIFPLPNSYKETGGTFALSNIKAIYADASFAKEANFLAEKLIQLLGEKPRVSAGKPDTIGGIQIIKTDLASEAYEIDMNAEQITLKAGDAAGAFYAIQSLLSLVPADAYNHKKPGSAVIPVVAVKDAPRFGFRAFMLDVGRNFHSKEEVLRVLDLMAYFKLNVFHLHFHEDEGWRIEMPSLPELTSIGARRGFPIDENKQLMPSFASGPDNNSPGTGYYTKADFIEILRYANDRHIRVIPEIESPGHARAAVVSMKARYERLMKEGKKEAAEEFMLHDPNDKSEYRSVQGWRDNVMNPANPGVYRFFARVFDDFIALYKEAGAPLNAIHLGGDEVPNGAWEKSPMAQDLIAKVPTLNETYDLWYYYYGKLNELLKARGLVSYGWEEAGMRKTKLDGKTHWIPNPDFARDTFMVDVWNNMLGWGAEDLAYRLANAGYEVVLSPVSNVYLDMSYYKNFDEPGYYWGGFVDLDKPWQFIPYDYYRNARKDKHNNDLPASFFEHKERLTEYGKKNIMGVQGLLWSETLTSPEKMEYMLLPKLFGVAERAWSADPAWTSEAEPMAGTAYWADWSNFVNRIGKLELPRLGYRVGKFNYRIPTPGLVVENGAAKANIQLPGFTLRYTTNGKEPNADSKVYTGAITEKAVIKVKAFDVWGRSGRTAEVNNQ
ncbi:family 20 glycosylhydrolase [Pseudoflavitalea sp. G-6-1-2]|uniref:family 20 glycosylhydrolase n=1 Tax=Pseudoflavitalea sp. G-6-1-2 TaxID=2728841 RepID=UPI00197D2C20|nr:family 20 glycosylhydrolase [Pseudoflavitalea sp. G-6-1-2]